MTENLVCSFHPTARPTQCAHKHHEYTVPSYIHACPFYSPCRKIRGNDPNRNPPTHTDRQASTPFGRLLAFLFPCSRMREASIPFRCQVRRSRSVVNPVGNFSPSAAVARETDDVNAAMKEGMRSCSSQLYVAAWCNFSPCSSTARKVLVQTPTD